MCEINNRKLPKISQNKKNCKAVIFDLDGTLIDSIGGISYSMNIVLKNHNLPQHTTESYKTFVGNGVRELVRKAIPCDMAADSSLLTLLYQEMKEQYGKTWDYQMSIYDGVEELLTILNANAVLFAVNTNKDTSFSKQIIDRYFPRWNISPIIGGNGSFDFKPDPEGALYIAKKLGVKNEECIYLGDSDIDIKTALNAGMFPVSVTWGFRSEKQLLDAGAQKIIRHPLELASILQLV